MQLRAALRAVGTLVVLAAVEPTADEGDAGGTTITLECGMYEERHTKSVDTSRCFVGDLCCCRYDAFDFADLLLTEEETVLVGRIEDVAGLPESLLVRRDVRATVAVHGVFRSGANPPRPSIHVVMSSDMFLWPETGESRIVARQAMAREHGQLRWDWEGETGSVRKRYRQDPFPNCDSGVFTIDRDGALEVGGTYLFALKDHPIREGHVEYQLSDNDRWNVFRGDEMDDVVHALNYTNICLSSSEIVYGPENEHVAIDICADYARGRTMPGDVGRRR